MSLFGLIKILIFSAVCQGFSLPVLLKFECALESPGWLLKTHIAAPHSEFLIQCVWERLGNFPF